MLHSLPFIALWKENGPDASPVLHILNQEAHCQIVFPEIGENISAVEEFLPELLDFLPKESPEGRWLLLLEPSLLESWLIKHWEPLTLQGRTIGSQALVVRSARWGAAEGDFHRDTRFLNLFPRSEFSFAPHFEHVRKSIPIRRVVPEFVKEDIASASDLIITAHGDDGGLIDQAGNPFVLPNSHPLPERIWLLACNVNEAMYRLAQRLLRSGCHTVITAIGDLSAPQMGQLITECFAGPMEHGQPFWLTRFTNALDLVSRDTGVTVWGSVNLDVGPSQAWNRISWDREHGSKESTTLHEDTPRDVFLGARDMVLSGHAWPITRRWMLPPLLWLAELHDHPSMRRFANLVGESTAPEIVRGLAAIARRTGDYLQTAKVLSITLSLPNLQIEERANSLGQLANLFIDMNLPESAVRAIESNERCNLNSSLDRSVADYRRLDWMARAQARLGNLDIALDYMTAKRSMANGDSRRELAWQLYLSSWGYLANQVALEKANAFAQETAELLGSLTHRDVDSGNSSAAYLLRALAVHAWTNSASSHIQILDRWMDYSSEKLTSEDPGPWAYTLAFMWLKKGDDPRLFERAISALERARYHLEASTLLGLAGRQHKQLELLGRFQSRRDAVLEALDANGIATFYGACAESKLRASIESRPLIDRSLLSDTGNLPL